MPQRILCSGCGCVLYNGEVLKCPQDVVKKYEGKCPECGKRLDFTLESVIIEDNARNEKTKGRRNVK